MSRLEAELKEEKKRRNRMKDIMLEAAVSLREALMVKHKSPEPEHHTSGASGHTCFS